LKLTSFVTKWIDTYFRLPFLIQFSIVFQYVLYLCIIVYYFILSLPDPLMLSESGIFHGASVHPISWVFVMLFALYVRVKTPLFNSRMRGTYVPFFFNTLMSLLLVTFAMGLTEFAWDVSMTWWWWVHNDLAGLTVTNYVLTYAFLLTGSAILVNVLLRNYRYFRHAWLIPVVIFGYEMIWLALGFHITSIPQYRQNTLSNLEEVIHWGLGIGIFGLLMK